MHNALGHRLLSGSLGTLWNSTVKVTCTSSEPERDMLLGMEKLESAFVVSKDVQSLKMKGCGQSTFARLVIADFKAEWDTRWNKRTYDLTPDKFGSLVAPRPWCTGLYINLSILQAPLPSNRSAGAPKSNLMDLFPKSISDAWVLV